MPQSVSPIYLLPSHEPVQVDSPCDPTFLATLRTQNQRLAKRLDIATARIGHLVAQVDEVMAICESREARIRFLEGQIASQQRRSLRLS